MKNWGIHDSYTISWRHCIKSRKFALGNFSAVPVGYAIIVWDHNETKSQFLSSLVLMSYCI